MTVGNLSFGLVVLCYLTALLLSFLNISTGAQRRIYWSCACVAGVFGALTTYPTWNNAAAMGIFFPSAMALGAYVATPYIKIGGKIYSFTILDPDPEDSTQQEIDPHPDSYSGLLTATTMWWCVVVLAVIASGNVYFAVFRHEDVWVGLLSGALFVLVTAPTAYGDASWRYPIARGQYIQFAVASVITAGVFPLLYLTTYYLALRHPLRRKQSMEYRVHPRHRKWED
ncbi:hypothetical protein [Mycolicibacter minnesotensis]